MALQTSGAISLNDIHVEAGGGSGTSATINDTDIRGLIGKNSGAQSSFNQFYGASATVTEQAYYEMTLLQTLSGQYTSWGYYSVNMAAHAGETGRLVFHYTNGTVSTSYRGDLQFDDVQIDGTQFNFENTNDNWVTSYTTTGLTGPWDTSTPTTYNAVIRNHTPMLVTQNSSYRFNVDSGGTGSSGTALSYAGTGSYYVYAETSGVAGGQPFSASSPLKTLSSSPGSMSYKCARYGSNIGTLRVYWAKNTSVDPYPPPPPVDLYGPWSTGSGASSVPWLVQGQYSTSTYKTIFAQWGGISTGDTCRMVIAYITGSSYTADLQLDDFWANAQSTSAGSGQTPLYIDTSQASQSNILTAYSAGYTFPAQAAVKTIYNNTATWTPLSSTATWGTWATDSGGTPSGGTGLYGLPSGPYAYYEATQAGFPYKMRLLRSRQFTATANRGFRGRVGAYGSAIGEARIFIVKE